MKLCGAARNQEGVCWASWIPAPPVHGSKHLWTLNPNVLVVNMWNNQWLNDKWLNIESNMKDPVGLSHLLWLAGWRSLIATPLLADGSDTARACPENCCGEQPPALVPPSGLPCDLWPSPTGNQVRRRRHGSEARWSGGRTNSANLWWAESAAP